MLNIKKASIASIIILVLIIGIAVASFATNTGIITKEAKLRKSPTNDSIILEIIPKKEEVEVLEKSGDWYRVKYQRIKGYVQKDFIEVEETVNTLAQNTVTSDNTPVTVENIKQGDTLTVKDKINIYIRPLINSKVIANIESGKTLTVTKIVNEWAYIKSEDKTGWIRLDAIKTNNPQNNNKNDNKQESAKKQEELNKTAYIASSGINFREEPNTDSKVLKVFAENAKITILAEQGEWYKIKHNDQVGYVVKTYVSEKKVSSRSSVDRNTENKTTTQTKKETENTPTQNTNSSKGQEVANYAKQFVGCKYVYGGSSPKGFDCSGLTMYVYKKFGVSLSHSATAQSKVGTKVSRSNLQPGDLVFFSDYRTKKGIGHVGIYIGNNKFVHASTERTGVITSSLSGSHSSRYVTATRFF